MCSTLSFDLPDPAVLSDILDSPDSGTKLATYPISVPWNQFIGAAHRFKRSVGKIPDLS